MHRMLVKEELPGVSAFQRPNSPRSFGAWNSCRDPFVATSDEPLDGDGGVDGDEVGAGNGVDWVHASGTNRDAGWR